MKKSTIFIIIVIILLIVFLLIFLIIYNKNAPRPLRCKDIDSVNYDKEFDKNIALTI